jgi:hypothetical protein
MNEIVVLMELVGNDLFLNHEGRRIAKRTAWQDWVELDPDYGVMECSDGLLVFHKPANGLFVFKEQHQ